MALSLRNPETQAKLSGILVGSSLVTLLIGMALAFYKYDSTMRTFVYGSKGSRLAIVYAFSTLSLLLAAVAFWFSYSSAGERRNSYSRLSWICFGVSALAIVLALVFLAANRYMASVVA